MTSDVPRGRRALAFRSPRAWLILIVVFAVGLTVDLGTKVWAFRSIVDQPVTLDRETLLADPSTNPIPRHDGIVALPFDLLDFRLVINRGAVFGIGADKRFLFIVFTFAALAAGFTIFAVRTHKGDHLAHIALALILAGGMGNLVDRIQFGVVRDFLHMLPRRQLPFGWNWPGGSREMFPWVFNVADVMLLAGMVLLMLHINRLEREREKGKENAETPKRRNAESA